MNSKKQIEKLIYDYHWMRREVDRLESIIFGAAVPMKSWGVAKYGDEAGMPRGSGGLSKSEIDALDLREERLFRRLQNYREKVFTVEKVARYLEKNLGSGSERSLIVIDLMMEGLSYRAIGSHLGISREKVRMLKSELMNHICQYCQFVHELKLEK